MAKIYVNITEIVMININGEDCTLITDISKWESYEPTAVIDWMRNHDTIEYWETWKTLYNPNLNPFEFDGVKKETGRYRDTYVNRNTASRFL